MSLVKKGVSSNPKGGKRDNAGTSTKTLKCDFELVSPPSPEGQVTLTRIRALLKEHLQPIHAELDELKTSVQSATKKSMKSLLLRKI